MPRATVCARCGVVPAPHRCTSPYWTPEWRALSAQIRQRDGACRVCGSRRRLRVHHLDNVADGHPLIAHPDRLTTVCEDCHNEYEGDRRAGRTTPLRRIIESL